MSYRTNAWRRMTCLVTAAGFAMALVPGAWAGTGATTTADDPATDYGRMVLVLDSSGSMSEPADGGVSKLQAAKQSLNQVVDQLPDSAYVGLRVYGATVFSKARDAEAACTDSQLAVEPGTDNRDALRQAVDEYRAFGETPTGYALREAAKDIGSEGSRSIVLVSDGKSNCEPDPCEVAEQIARRGIDLQIDVVGLAVNAEARRELECVAEKGGGTYYDADSADEIVDSLSHVASRAIRPFTLHGEPADGSTNPAEAPVLEPGQYVDTLGATESPRGALHYTVERTMERSTLHFSAMSQGTAGDSFRDWDEIELTTTTPDGTACASGVDQKMNETSGVISAVVAVGPHAGAYEDPKCSSAESSTVTMTRGGMSDSAASEVGILVSEEPPVEGVRGLPLVDDPDQYVAPQVTEQPQKITGGTSFDNATEIDTGSYALGTVPGELQIFKVSLDWGQQLSVRASFPGLSDPSLQEYVDDLDSMTVLSDLSLYNPMRGRLDGYADGSEPSDFPLDEDAGHISAITPHVRYLNREESYDNTAYLPGDYYIAVASDHDDEGETYVVPYTLDVEVKGEPSGAPAYVDQASYTGPELDTGDGTDPAGSGDDGESDDTRLASQGGSGDDRGVKIAAATALGVAGLGCLVLAGLSLRRRTGAPPTG